MKDKGKILIVDDNRELLTALRLCLSSYFSIVDTLYDPNRLPGSLSGKSYDLVLLDMNFSPGQTSGNEGLYWMNRIKESIPGIGVVMITAYGDVSLAVKAVREGASDFILKSWDEAKIISTVLAAMNLRESQKQLNSLKDKSRHLRKDIDERYSLYYGNSPAMLKVKNIVEKVAPTDANILILGENGTGKELIAREIHRKSKRSDDIFVKIDLGAVSESLFESELFGYKKGAFTDAKHDKPGRLEIASGGTVFLDEIGNLSMDMQAKLLSVLQNREIVRLGDSKPIPVDIRIVSATNMDLHKAVDELIFREDLFYRLNTIIINLPSLRDRKEDITFLARVFLEEINNNYNRETVFSEEALAYMMNHLWPGNIRELRHIVEKGVILAENNRIEESDLRPDNSRKAISKIKSFNLLEHEKLIVEAALERFDWNISRAAKELGINRSTLYEKIAKYEISKN